MYGAQSFQEEAEGAGSIPVVIVSIKSYDLMILCCGQRQICKCL
nr:MAG TPA: hypothetical protein [Caudoviricetes sp.]